MTEQGTTMRINQALRYNLLSLALSLAVGTLALPGSGAAQSADEIRVALGLVTDEQASDGGPRQPEAMRTLRILVADDSPFNQQVAGGLLELQGHSVCLAGDGREAIERYQQEPFDFIFMDVEMPQIDGLAATQRIRELEQVSGGHIPIVGLSAHALVGFREQCLAAGMDGYITKPIQTEELFGALHLVDQLAQQGLPAPASS